MLSLFDLMAPLQQQQQERPDVPAAFRHDLQHDARNPERLLPVPLLAEFRENSQETVADHRLLVDDHLLEDVGESRLFRIFQPVVHLLQQLLVKAPGLFSR